jgi:hypothetical protein
MDPEKIMVVKKVKNNKEIKFMDRPNIMAGPFFGGQYVVCQS